MSESPQDPVKHQPGIFFIERGGKRVAELTYAMVGESAVGGHTWADPTMRGGRLAPDHVAPVVDWARSEKHTITPVCSYVRRVMDRSPEQYADVRKS